MNKYLLVNIFFLLLYFSTVSAQDAPKELSCLDCHDVVLEGQLKHEPARESCADCHQSTGNPHPSDSTKGFTLFEELPGLCFVCHEETQAKYMHGPVEGGECTVCHDPHSSPYASLLLADPVSGLCFGCHDQEIVSQKVIHPPVDEGNCTACHNAHGSDYRSLILSELPDLCYRCHEDVSAQMSETHVHPPAEDDCRNCHTVHSSSFDALLSESKVELCLTCHDGVGESMQNDPFKHKIVFEKKACMNCHSPHGSSQDKFLVNDPTGLCLGCHNKIISTESGRIENIYRLITNSKVVHGAIEFDGCRGCHVPHCSIYTSLLNAAFPDGLYAEGTPGNYNLCFSCHDEAMIKEKETKSATNFRNAEQNLHFLHTAGHLGRSCALCHDMHGSMYEHLIKSSVTYGNWQMPLLFSVNENGGSCSTGCHGLKKYDRVSFVDNSALSALKPVRKIPKYIEQEVVDQGDDEEATKTVVSTKQIDFENLIPEFKKVELPSVLFKKRKSEIIPGTESDLINLINFMKKHPEARILIKGFTDAVDEKNFDMTLSIHRAEKVKRMMVAYGISKDRIETKGFGSADPVASNKSRQGREENRRVEFELIQ